MRRVLAIDYGERRLGLAVSDELHFTARPLMTLPRIPKRESFTRLKQVVEEMDVGRVVVGLPLRLDATRGDAVVRVEDFMRELSQYLDCPIVSWDERLTSHEALARMRECGLSKAAQQARIDQFAALIILEDYLANNTNSIVD